MKKTSLVISVFLALLVFGQVSVASVSAKKPSKVKCGATGGTSVGIINSNAFFAAQIGGAINNTGGNTGNGNIGNSGITSGSNTSTTNQNITANSNQTTVTTSGQGATNTTNINNTGNNVTVCTSAAS